MTVTRAFAARQFAVLVHGGAGSVKQEFRASREAGCRVAADSARAILRGQGSALDAVQRAVEILEDDPGFNAGTGASLTSEGGLELDAAIMQGRGFRAGAVCALGPFKNPIAIARRALEEGGHVLYAAAGAEAFARRQGFEPSSLEQMKTEQAREKLAEALAGRDPGGGSTVGAVALDLHGDVAAATSTGGISGKAPGRVGDTPLLGAGTYAEAGLGAASATGHGESIMKLVLTLRALEALRGGAAPDAAAAGVLALMLESVGSKGGLIVLAADGRVGLSWTTASMPWAAALDDLPSVTGS